MKAPEELIQKYMDGALTPEEDAELRSMLSEDELTRIKADKGLYEAVLKRLADAPPCPELLWEHVRARINDSAPASKEPIRFPSFLSFAAMLVLGFGVVGLLLYMNPPDRQPVEGAAFVSTVQFASAIPDFAAQADVQGGSHDLLDSLKKHGFNSLKLSDATSINGHSLKPLGIKYCECSGKKESFCNCSGHQVAQFLFECCGKQIIVLVSDKTAPIGADSFKLSGMKNFQITATEVGDYRLVAAGQHSPNEVLELFAAK